MNVPDRIKGLTETFDKNLESYKKGIYNETQVHREFIDPFFEELGWDIANKQDYAESRVPQSIEMLRRQIESTDRQIDQLVYTLYNLTEEEIKIVESEK